MLIEPRSSFLNIPYIKEISMSKNRVYPAEPYRHNQMGSFGKAENMLIRQFQFPDIYREDEQMLSGYSDRLAYLPVNFKKYDACFRHHTGRSDSQMFEYWLKSANDTQIFNFCMDIMNVPPTFEPTGYCITGTVAGNGQALWHFSLFSKKKESNTAVYTGENAPNVLTAHRRP